MLRGYRPCLSFAKAGGEFHPMTGTTTIPNRWLELTIGLPHSRFAAASRGTMRLKLLKIGALVRGPVCAVSRSRCPRPALPRARVCPYPLTAERPESRRTFVPAQPIRSALLGTRRGCAPQPSPPFRGRLLPRLSPTLSYPLRNTRAKPPMYEELPLGCCDGTVR